MKYILGFRLLSPLEADGLAWRKAAAVAIVKGQAIFDDGDGYATNTATAFAQTFQGVAAASVDNSGGSVGDLDVPIIPPRPNYKFIVQNESATQIAQTDVGEIVDLESADGIDVTDTTCVHWGFQVDKIDITTEALAADGVAVTGGGFAIGRFLQTPDES